MNKPSPKPGQAENGRPPEALRVQPVRKVRRRRSPSSEPFLTREDWIQKARKVLIRDGVDNISIEKMAQVMNVTRGSFYWHFSGRQELLDELLTDWEATNTKPFLDIERKFPTDGDSALNAIFDIWLEEKDYDPSYDAAIRDWARTNPDVANVVRRVDRKRIDVFQHIFLTMGFSKKRAMIRARVAYFTQVGYYILGLQESKRQRNSLRDLYFETYTGHSLKGAGKSE